jgi:hypothetical protein
MIQAELPNGTILEFPDGTSQEVIERVAKEQLGISQPVTEPVTQPVTQPDTGFWGDVGNFFRGTGAGFTQTVPLAAEGLAGLAWSAFEKAGLVDIIPSPDENSLVEWGRETRRDLVNFFGGDAQSDAYGVGNALGSFASFAIPYGGQAAFVAKGLSLTGKIIGRGGVGSLAIGSGAGEQVDRILALNESLGKNIPEADQQLSIFMGGGIGVTELATARLPIGIILSRIKKGTNPNVVRRLVSSVINSMAVGGAEGTQEAVAGLLQDLVSKNMYDPTLEIGQSMASDFGYGASAGAIFQAALELMIPRKRGGVFGKLKKEPETTTVDPESDAERVIREQREGLDPRLALPSPEPILLLEDHRSDSRTIVSPEEDASSIAQSTLVELGSDLPLAFNRGVITVDETGAPDVYQVNRNDDGYFVETKNGVRASPTFSLSEQAEIFKSELNFGVQEILVKQDEIETEILAKEAVAQARPEEKAQLLAAARATINPTTASFNDVSNNTATLINAHRLRIGKQELTPQDSVTLDDLANVGASVTEIERLLPSIDLGTTTADIDSIALSKNIKIEDAGFERFARRVAGHSNYKLMQPKQLDYLATALNEIPALPGTEPQSLPTIKEPIFNSAQYQTVMAASRNKEARPELGLAEGEILKSDVNEVLGLKRGGAPTEAILETAIQRGDFIRSRQKANAYIHKDRYKKPEYTTSRQVPAEDVRKIRRSIQAKARKMPEKERRDAGLHTKEGIEQAVYDEIGLAPTTRFARGEPIEAEAIAAATVREEEQSDEAIRRKMGDREGIIIRRSDTNEEKGGLLERSREFKARLNRALIPKETRDIFGSEKTEKTITNYLKKRMSKYGSAIPNFDPKKISMGVKKTLGGRGERGDVLEIDDKIIITLALDAVEGKTDREKALRLGEVMDHEIVHVLRKKDVISEADWKLLTKFVKAKRPTREGVEYEETWYEEAKRVYSEYAEINNLAMPTEAEVVEESIANSFSDWSRGMVITGKPQSIFRRIVDFFTGLGNGLTNANINSVSQVFTQWSGETRTVTPEAAASEAAPEAQEETQRLQEEAEKLRQTEPDAPKRSLLDKAARKVLGSEHIQEGNVTRRVRFRDLTRAMIERQRTGRLTREEEERDTRDVGKVARQLSLPRQLIKKNDTAFTVRNTENDDITLNGKRVPPRSAARRLSVVDILYNPQFSDRSGNGINYIAELLNQRSLRVLKNKVILEKDSSKDNLISDVLALEVKAHLRNGDKASGWYSVSVKEALDKAAILHPEIATDPESRFLFLVSLAVTSQNTDVISNIKYANQVYNQYKQEQRATNRVSAFPLLGWGKHKQSMINNFQLLNHILESVGSIGAVKEFFDTETTVRDLKKTGFKVPSSEGVNEKVFGSYLLGAKVGQGFYQNLSGNFNPLTMDLWFMRTMGRLTGRLVGSPEKLPTQQERLYKALLKEAGIHRSNSKAQQAETLADAIENNDTDTVIELADELRIEHDQLFRTPEVRALYDAKKYNKPEWAKAAEAIVTEQLKPKDQPHSASYRKAVRRVISKTMDKLKADGIDLDTANFQAIIWYPEKQLTKRLGARVKDLNLNYSQAMDRLLADETQTDIRSLERGRGREGADVRGRDEGVLGELGKETERKLSLPRQELTQDKTYSYLRGRGMSLTLEQEEDGATLVIKSGGRIVEVRGQPAVGAVYEGGPLDQVIDSIPRRANISSLFAGETINIPPEWTTPVVNTLEKVEREANVVKESSALLEFIKASPEGFTISIDMNPAPTTGYVVAPIKAAEMIVVAEDLDMDAINEFSRNVEQVVEATNREVFAGGWFNNETNQYYLDAVHIYAELDTALYVADSSDQIAIFNLGEFNEIKTEEGIRGLEQSGTYSDQARNESRRNIEAYSRRFEEARDTRQRKFSLPRQRPEEQVTSEREALNRHLLSYASSVPPSALAPVHQVEKLFILNGRGAPIIVTEGHDEKTKKGNTVGFGKKHADKHLPLVVRNTPYNSIEEMLDDAMASYWPHRNNPEDGGFTITERPAPVIGLLPRIKMEWESSKFGYPAVFVFQPISYEALVSPTVREVDPYMDGRKIMILQTAWSGPSRRASEIPVLMPSINPTVSADPQMRITVDRAINDAVNNRLIDRAPSQFGGVLSLKRKYSLPRSVDNIQNPNEKSAIERNFDMGADETFWDKVLRTFKASDPDDHTFGTRFRAQMVDKAAGTTATERKVLKLRKKMFGEEYQLAMDSATSSAFSLLSRKSGVVAAGLVHGPIVRDRGRIYAITEKLMNHPNGKIAALYTQAFERMANETAYVDPITKETIRYEKPSDLQGLVNILKDIDQQGLWAQFFLYSAAKRAQRLRNEGREKTISVADEQLGLELGKTNPAIVRAHQQYQLWNNAAVNVMRDSGVISEQAANLWKVNADYLPFYRELYDDVGVNYEEISPKGAATGDTLFRSMKDPNNRIFDSFYHIKQPKELKGGKPVHRIMVNNVADSKMFTDKDNIALQQRIDFLTEQNPGARIRRVTSNQRIRDPLNNILRNFDAAVTSSMQNTAVSRAVRDLGELGLARRLDAEHLPDDPSPTRIGIRVNGETRYYEVQDSLLMNAISASQDISMPGLGIQAMPATLLRELVTKDPAFMAANMLRDTFSAWVTSGVNIIPVAGTLKGYTEALLGTASAEALAASGVTGGYDFKGDPKNALSAFRKHLRMKQPYKPRNIARAMWEYADKISGASDTSTRVAVYNKVLKQTGDETAAIIEALEVINFSRKGANPIVRYMTAVVPFLNARIQGLDVLYRGATGNMTPRVNRKKRMLGFYFKASLIVGLTAAYHMWHMAQDEEEDPWYYNAPEYIKDNYWILPPNIFGVDTDASTPALRIPIPFEVGVLFKVIPERIMQLIDGQTNSREALKSMGRHVTGTFNVSFPQWFQPILEVATNKNWYTGRPIVSYWQDQNESWLANPMYVSPAAIELAKYMDEIGVRWDAEKIDHFFRGYTGTLGSYALMAADSIMRDAANMPDRPQRRLDEKAVVGRFLQEPQGRGPIQAFYDIYNELKIFNSTLAQMEKYGRPEAIEKYLSSRDDLTLYGDYVTEIGDELAEIRQFRSAVLSDKSADAEDKAKMIAEIDLLTNQILANINKEIKTLRLRQ